MNMSGYDRSSVSMYVHAYLYQYVSALFTEQKRKYIIYGACRWIIAFNGTTKHQNSYEELFAHR